MVERRGVREQHAAAGLHQSAGRQLMQAQHMLSSWIDRHKDEGMPLPPPLHHGPVELLQRVLELTDSPHASAKLHDDAVILLLYGASFLQDHYDVDSRGRARVEAFARQHRHQREQWKCKALEIQATWRTQRFHTNRLPVLSLQTASFLQPEVEELMQRKKLHPQDSLENLTAVPIQINQQELETQVVAYAEELRKRVDARRRDEDEMQKKQLKDQRMQEERRKRMIVQKKKRHEYACRRWHYLTTRLLRMVTHDVNDSERPVANEADFSRPKSPVVDANISKNVDRSKVMQQSIKQARVPRTFVRWFVSKAIARGISRVLCTFNMGRGDVESSSSALPRPRDTATPDTATTNSDTDAVLRLGLLLCDLHFGIKYTGLYQRYFARAARQRGLRVEWQVFNCLRSQFPTNAHTRTLHGYLVAGGPNIGVAHGESAHQERDFDARRRSSISGSRGKNRHVGRWRERLLTLLRDLHGRKQILLGAMGLGHVLLAEALGARVGMKEWEDGWSVLDPMIFSNESSTDQRQNQGKQGVRFLHGEFVQSFRNGKTIEPYGFKAWKNPGESSFVACFRDPLTLSMDGSPECGGFVFETLGELYDRDKVNQARQSKVSHTTTSTTSLVRDEDADQDGFSRVLMGLMPSLDEKRKRLGIANASERIAHLFLDHFGRQIATKTPSSDGTMAITGAVCSGGIFRVDASLRYLLRQRRVDGVFINATASTDGHLMVTNPKAFAVLVDHDKRAKEYASKQRLSVGSSLGQHTTPRRNSTHRPPVLTMAMLRDQDRALLGAPTLSSGSSNQLSPQTVRLPSLWHDESTHSLSSVMPSSTENHHRLLGGRTSSMSSKLSTPDSDGISVLTLSRALSFISVDKLQVPSHKTAKRKRVFLRVLDEECKQTHELLPYSKADLRTVWLRLTAAIRLADLNDDQIAIVSRQSLVLEYIKRRRPTWTFVKDCRRSDGTHQKRVKKVALYAAYADIVLLDQDFLLSNSANENDALLRTAWSFGLEVYVAPRDESPKDHADTVPPKKTPSHMQKKLSSGGRRASLSQAISTHPIYQGDSAEYDMQVVEFMLLKFSGVDGVITCHPEAAVDALERIAAKNDAMQQVEQLFRDWQAKDKDIAKASSSPHKRTVSTLHQVDPTLEEDVEDYTDSHYDSDDSIPEQEIEDEIARQRVEHFDVGSSVVMATNDASVGTPAVLGGAALTAAPFVPLRPLKPKSGDDVFGASVVRRQFTTQTLTSSTPAVGGGRLRSIGSFRGALKRMSSAVPPFSTGLHHGQSRRDHSDSRNEIRGAVGASLAPTPPLPSARSLKPTSMRKIFNGAR